MVKNVTIKPCDSKTLQKTIDATGNTPAEYYFCEGDYLINSLLRVYNFTKWTCDPCVKFELMEHAPLNPFGCQVPLISSKYKTGITGLEFAGFSFDGHYKTQKYSTKAGGDDHGKGFHNVLGFGDPGNPAKANITDSSFHDLTFWNSQGDSIRPEGAKGLEFFNLKGDSGHDIIHANGLMDSEIYGCNVNTRANNFVRLRESNNVSIHDNIASGKGTYAPIIQVQSITKGRVSTGITVSNNKLSDALGPGIQIIGTYPGNKGITVKENIISRCGTMPAANRLSGVGGIVFDGYDGVTIEGNVIDSCRGYGILAGKYDTSSSQKGKATLKNNTVTNTKKSYCVGTMSGTGIANLTAGRYSITKSGNILKGNATCDYYKV